MIDKIEVDGQIYDVNDPRVDKIDEVVVVDPNTLSVEEFHELSKRYKEGNVTIILRINDNERAMVDYVDHVPLGEGYSHWIAHSLVTENTDDVDFFTLLVKVYRVFYAAHSDQMEFQTYTREFSAGGG